MEMRSTRETLKLCDRALYMTNILNFKTLLRFTMIVVIQESDLHHFVWTSVLHLP